MCSVSEVPGACIISAVHTKGVGHDTEQIFPATCLQGVDLETEALPPPTGFPFHGAEIVLAEPERLLPVAQRSQLCHLVQW